MSASKLLFVFGTRPEAIKLAPVIHLAREQQQYFDVRVCVTAQHREMLDQVMRIFRMTADIDLNLMQHDQSLDTLAAQAIERLGQLIGKERPDWVIVQGDTTTTFATAVATYFHRAKLGHVEAGLRTYNKYSPFPEELNRRLCSSIADLHFAPTQQAAENLRRENVSASTIHVTGNTVVDALNWAVRQPHKSTFCDKLIGELRDSERKLILVTLHRRESFGPRLENICLALKDIAEQCGERAHILLPVHLNPNVSKPVRKILSGLSAVTLTEPLDYLPLIHLLQASHLVLTDSGGIQEEAPSFRKPVLVLRDVTERPEGVSAGVAKLVGTDRHRIVEETLELLQNQSAYNAMTAAENPYGDGHASGRILQAVLNYER
jgi:UDP-N-acetylglucosamine 2-epimerase (non-hydrolysing)